ncbi:MAG: hypothetical protein PHY10_03935, partial [Patescibacteria group bacterium]|nr:hypothetical protein [Patescibacteria group bacterium]
VIVFLAGSFILKSISVIAFEAQNNENKPRCLVNDRGLNCQKNIAGDPLIIKENAGLIFYLPPQEKLNFAADKYHFLALRLKTTADFSQLSVNFLNPQGGAKPLNNFIFNKKNNQFTDYYFNLSNFDAWYGMVDRLYLKFNPSQIEVDSFSLLSGTPGLVLKTLWQEYFSLPAEGLSWINMLPPIFVYATPLSYYILIFTAIILIVLYLFNCRDSALRAHWQKIFLIVVLVAWFCSGIYFLRAWFLEFKDDYNLSSKSNDQKRAILINSFLQDNSGTDLNSYLRAVKEKIPLGSKIFLPPSTDYRRIVLIYDLIDQYQVVGDINLAKYVLSYFALEANYDGFEKIVVAPNQLIYYRK